MTTIITGCTLGFSKVGHYTVPRWQAYAGVNGCKFVFQAFEYEGKSTSWDKLWAIRKLLLSGHDQVFWVDADSVPMEPCQFDLFAEDWYSAVDGYGLCNSHILVRNTSRVIQLLDTMLFLGDPKNFRLYHSERKWEQDTLKDLVFTYDSVDRMVQFLPPEMIQHGSVTLPGCVAFHVPCLPLDERLAKLKSVRKM